MSKNDNYDAFSVPDELAVPESQDTRLGKLNFKDGAPSKETIDIVLDNLDFTRALQAYMDGHQGASMAAILKGIKEAGAKDNEIILYSEMMDSKPIFLTPNADTIYYFGAVDLSNGPLVFESPPDALGVIDDMWFNHVTDFGRPGPERGTGGKFLLVPPNYTGSLPDGGLAVAHSQTRKVLILGRSFLVNNEAKPVVDTIKNTLKIYPYTEGGYGTSIKTILKGNVHPEKQKKVTPVKFIEGSGLYYNTVPPSDYTYFDLLNDHVQNEEEGAFSKEITGSLAAIGIAKGKPFKPDSRMKKILSDAAAVGNATGRSLNFGFRGELPEEDFAYYEGSSWYNWLFMGGFSFDTPPPEVENGVIKPHQEVGHRRLASRFGFFHWATGITPAMCMKLTDIGSQYLLSCLDSNKKEFDGSKSYVCKLPANIPQNNFWSMTLYDNQTRSMLRTDQRWPRAGSQSNPTPAAVENEDGTTDIYFGPEAPKGKESNWIQTVPGKGWFAILRLYSPLQPFFDKTWRPSEIEPVEFDK